MSLITLKNISVTLGRREVLHDISLHIDRGEILTIVGPNGSGKSTLLRTVIGAIKPTRGQIEHAPDLRIGYVPQRLHIDPTLPLTVKRFMSLPKRVDHATIHAALDRAGAGHLCYHRMTDLSGGQFQRVLLARALLCRPDLLILDEATQGLDQAGSADFYDQIEEVRRDTGAAILMVSHELHVVMAASDRVVCLNGHVCCQGAPEHVASAPEYRALFGRGTHGALALYRHQHSHTHHHDPNNLEHDQHDDTGDAA
ncbi:zinc ABC transporter ATP-binding protein ZnuC [Celeribacter sp.]|uniref:zinc ABC transporter ATP-binding protein ZnuC n=1 Tax=Celeribacter sp. TaxID=1890673 RepID=UPI003A954F79